MFFRSPFLRLFAHDFEHMMNRSLLRHEMMMRNELQRAMNFFEALEQPSSQRAKAPEAIKGKEAESKQSITKEAEAPSLKASESQADAMKVKESETKAVKTEETENKVSPKEQEVSVQPERRDVFSVWDNSIDHFFRDMSPFGYRSSFFDDFNSRFNSMSRLMEEMRTDMDKQFKTLENPEAKPEYPTLADPENTTYFQRIVTNDNGHVKVKTISKKPGSEWESKFEEYKGGKPVLESENKQTIESEANVKESLEASQKKEKPVEIEDETQKSSGSASSTSA